MSKIHWEKGKKYFTLSSVCFTIHLSHCIWREKLLNNRITVYRAEKAWTQQELANRVKVSRQTIINVEKNKYTPSVVLAYKIAQAFNVEITEVFIYTEEDE